MIDGRSILKSGNFTWNALHVYEDRLILFFFFFLNGEMDTWTIPRLRRNDSE